MRECQCTHVTCVCMWRLKDTFRELVVDVHLVEVGSFLFLPQFSAVCLRVAGPGASGPDFCLCFPCLCGRAGITEEHHQVQLLMWILEIELGFSSLWSKRLTLCTISPTLPKAFEIEMDSGPRYWFFLSNLLPRDNSFFPPFKPGLTIKNGNTFWSPLELDTIAWLLFLKTKQAKQESLMTPEKCL